MLSFCGIDVAKDRLDVVVLPEQQCLSVRNDVDGWAELVEQLRSFAVAAIGLEATGGYERGIMRTLLAAGMSVRQINPFRLRQFARASGVVAADQIARQRRQPVMMTLCPTEFDRDVPLFIPGFIQASAECCQEVSHGIG